MPFLEIHLDRESRIPFYLQIKNQVKDMILNGLLENGRKLHPSRELARILKVNRTTVVSAYNELQAEGFLESRVGSGTVVSGRQIKQSSNYQPMNWSELFAYSPQASYYSLSRDLANLFFQRDTISFGLVEPDPKYIPGEEFQRISRKVFKEKGNAVFLLSPVEGYYPLREFFADWMAREGRATSPEEVLITSGSTHGLYLLSISLLKPGDVVALENPTSFHSIQIFRAAEAKLIDIPVDESGMKVDILENLLSRQRVKLIYTVPTYQNPSGTVLSLARRQKLLSLAHQYNIPIIEENPYGKLNYGPAPPPSLKVLDGHDQVILLNTFSKILVSGLRIGWLIAPKPVIRQLASARYLMDLHSNTFQQYMFHEFCQQKKLDRHLQKIRKIYARKRDLLISSLDKYCSSSLTWQVPEGGCHLWCRIEGNVNAVELLHEAIFDKVAFIEGKVFSPKENCDEWFRLSFTSLEDNQIEEGVRRLGRALERMRRRHGIKGRQDKSSHRPFV